MASPINSSNWPGPNCAGMGGTPAPGVADDGTGLHGTQYSGDGTKGKVYSVTGGAVAGASPTNVSTPTLPMQGDRR
jgi:hypothetical protein